MAQENLRETLGLEQVVELREKTEKISRFLLGQLRDYLETLRPLLAPARVFGKHVRSPLREDVPDGDRLLGVVTWDHVRRALQQGTAGAASR